MSLVSLSPAQLRVARLVAEGMCNAVIAEELGISTWTVKQHLVVIFDKLGVTSRVKLALYLMERAMPHQWSWPRDHVFRSNEDLGAMWDELERRHRANSPS